MIIAAIDMPQAVMFLGMCAFAAFVMWMMNRD